MDSEVFKVPSKNEDKKVLDLKYEEPDWGGLPPDSSDYKIEVIKSGQIHGSFDLKGKSFFVLGRLSSVDIPQEHPSVSRHHVVLQFRPGAGFFLYDLDSAHGTFHNKKQVLPRTWVPLRVGHGLKLGMSSRLLILKGPDQDEEPEVSMELVKRKIKSREPPSSVTWGIPEDAVEEEDSTGENNPFASELPLDLEDPKKTLRNWFEREGLEGPPEYKVEDKGKANFSCTLEIILDAGETLCVEANAGRKKDSIVQCALKACQLLDQKGLLRASSSISKRKSASKEWEERDYYESDDDEFLDRTGNIQAKRKKRMKLACKIEDSVETYDSLQEKLILLEAEKARVEKELSVSKGASNSEDLDDYVSSLKGSAVDKHTIDKLKLKLAEHKREILRLSKLSEIAKPSKALSSMIAKPLPMKKIIPGGVMIGKRSNAGIFGKTRIITKPNKDNAEKDAKNESRSSVTKNIEIHTTKESNEHLEEKNVKNDSSSSDTKNIEIHTTKKSNEHLEEKDSSYLKVNLQKPVEKAVPTVTGDNESLGEIKTKKTEGNKKTSLKKPSFAPKTPVNDEGKITGSYSDSCADPKYSTWTPPANQSGDGRTSLNDKFGY